MAGPPCLAPIGGCSLGLEREGPVLSRGVLISDFNDTFPLHSPRVSKGPGEVTGTLGAHTEKIGRAHV